MDALLGAARHVIVLDHLAHATTAKAEVVLPAATFAEADGTLVNNEGRAQRFFQVFDPGAATSGKAGAGCATSAARPASPRARPGETSTTSIAAMARELPVLQRRCRTLRRRPVSASLGQKIPRQPHRYSGRTAMHADVDVHEPQPPDDPDSPLAFSMEGFDGQPPAALIPRFWAPGWNSVQAVNKFQDEVGGPLRGGDPGRRLIEPPTRPGDAMCDAVVPAAFEPRAGEWLVVPCTTSSARRS